MKTEKELKELQAVAIIYLNKHRKDLDVLTQGYILGIADFICLLTGHNCGAAYQLQELFEESREYLEELGVDIGAAVEYVEEMEEAHTRRKNANLN